MNDLPENAPPVTAIIAIVGHAFGYSAHDMLGKRVFRDLARARQVAMYLSTEVVGHSHVHAGRWFGRDNSTIWYARHFIGKEIKRDPEMARRVSAAMARVENWRAELVALPASQLPGVPADGRISCWPAAAQRLEQRGWSVAGIARHLQQPPHEVARVLGVQWSAARTGVAA